MSREFSTSEIIRQKCSICGSKNKLYTEIRYKGIHYGYMLTCCNCGHVDTFIESYNGPSGILYADFQKGKEVCIQLTTCTHTDCKYYGKFKIWDAATTIDDLLNGKDSESSNANNSVDCGCGSQSCSCNRGCAGLDGDSDIIHLNISEDKSSNPRFH